MFVFTALIGLGTGGRSFATEVVMTGPADAAPLRSTAYTDTSSEAGSQVRSDGNGLWICVFSSDDTLNDTIDTDFDLLYVTSTDDGASWSDPSPLNTNAVGDNANDVNPQLATDGAGTWIVVWRTVEITGTYNPDGELAYSRSLDNGQSWSPPAVLNSTAPTDGATNDAGQKIATNGAGAWVCVWTADPLTGSPDILCTYSLDNGQSWSSAATVNSRAAVIDRADARPSLATDGQGTWMCVWDSNDNFGDTTGLDWDIMYAVSTNDGQTWSDQAPLNSNAIRGGDDTAPAVASDGRGTWVVTWLSHDSRVFGGDSDVAYAVSTDLGATWSDIAPIHPDAAADWNADEDVKIETDGKGRWVVVWESWNPLDGLIGNEQDLLFAVSTSPAIGWSAPAPLNSYAMFDDEQNQDAGGGPQRTATAGGSRRGRTMSRTATPMAPITTSSLLALSCIRSVTLTVTRMLTRRTLRGSSNAIPDRSIRPRRVVGRTLMQILTMTVTSTWPTSHVSRRTSRARCNAQRSC